MSWALSCCQLRKFYKDVELVTDNFGKMLLIERMQLPYTKVTLRLNNIDSYHHHLWALGKITAYEIQREPFIHVDGDVYIFDAFDKAITESDLACQNLDLNLVDYDNALKHVGRHFSNIPGQLSEAAASQSDVIGSNAGILGGKNVAFFREYTAIARKFIDDNVEVLDRFPLPDFNIIFEQYLFYCLAKTKKLSVGTVFAEPDSGGVPERCVRFHKVPTQAKYIHMIAGFKRNNTLAQSVRQLLRIEHPEMYFRILAGCRSFLT
jgi:hypothetical protein